MSRLQRQFDVSSWNLLFSFCKKERRFSIGPWDRLKSRVIKKAQLSAIKGWVLQFEVSKKQGPD
jgi:hypothetical protein